ncbi:hypothetical protein JVY00_08585 [Tsukamurella tyrosinosolvens]|uniref:hypothetical protein n=1 Tax=Tsukamurella tyrosinosolvens TaxID=57704 RepID=UPI001AF6AFE3|nr:hypothetical protein [Tsukamurella tyrosinosolvens]QRY86092.1 hypothetical protein JVY00_08585 [Tsukamurella tyrosinosolvens]
MIVDELRAMRADLPGDVPILVSGNEGGFARVAHGGVVEVQELDRGEDQAYFGRFGTPEQAAEELGGPGSEWTYMVGGTRPYLVGEPITALVLSREGR